MAHLGCHLCFIHLQGTVAHPDRIDSRCDAVFEAELPQDILQMPLDCGGADSQGRSDLFVTLGLDYQRQHPFFLRRERHKIFFVAPDFPLLSSSYPLRLSGNASPPEKVPV